MPADRMKAGRKHRVTLSDAVTQLLGKNRPRMESAFKRGADAAQKSRRSMIPPLRPGLRLPDTPRDTPLRPIKTAAIVGAGTMGGWRII